MADLLSLDLERTRDLKGREDHVWARRAVLAIFALIGVFALLNGVGQRASTVSRAGPATGPVADLEVKSPTRVRGGLLFQARITIRARRQIRQPLIVLGPGWLDGLTLNTLEPAAASERSRDGGVELSYGTIQSTEPVSLYLEYQVNPTTVGRKTQRVTLYDGQRRLVSLDRELTVLP